MVGRVDGKVCLVTGGGSGLGRSDAILLAREGARVVVTDIDDEGGEETVQLAGAGAIFMHHDVADEDRWQSVISGTVDHFGALNVLVNNAGFVVGGNVEDVTNENWRKHQAVHMDGTFWGLKHGIAAIKQNGEPGSIINMSSTTAILGYSSVFAYAACKGAVRSMTKSAAIHCQQQGYSIRINSLHPGTINTPMITARQAQQDAIIPNPDVPLPDPNAPPGPGLGEPEDVGWTVVFLASDESKFINGVELPIDNCSIIKP